MTPEKIHLCGKFGVANIELRGGPRDGEFFMGVVGAPILVTHKLKEPEKKKESSMGYYSLMVWGGNPQADEGEDWKKAAEQKTKKLRHFALYCPQVVGGKATLYAVFVGIVEVPA